MQSHPTNCFESWNGVLVVEQELLEWRGSRKGWVEETFEFVPITTTLRNLPLLDVEAWNDPTNTFI